MSYEAFVDHPLVSEVPEDLIRRLYDIGELLHVEPDVDVLEEGAPPENLFVVLDGELEVYLPKTQQRLSRVKLATVGQGTCIGEYGFVDRRPVSASVKTLGNVTLLRIAHSELRRFIEHNPVAGYMISRNLMVALVDRLRSENDALDLFYLPGGDA